MYLRLFLFGCLIMGKNKVLLKQPWETLDNHDIKLIATICYANTRERDS